MKLPQVRQLQETSLALRRVSPVGPGWAPAANISLLFTVFAHIEALRLQPQHRNKVLPPFLQYKITLLRPGRPRSGGPQLGVLWEPQETPRRPPGDPQEAPRRLPGDPQETFQEPSQETSQKTSQESHTYITTYVGSASGDPYVM